jgi:hypothetical protein
MAHHDMADLPPFHPGADQRGAGGMGGDVDGRQSCKRPAKAANGSAGRGKDVDVGHGSLPETLSHHAQILPPRRVDVTSSP